MGYDLSRTVLVVVSVLTVLLAASLFPASGYGTYPGSVGGGAAGPAEPATEGSPGTVEATDGPATTEAPATTTRGPEATDTTDERGDPTRTTEPPTSTRTTEAPGAEGEPDAESGFPMLSFLIRLFTVFSLLAVVAGVLALFGEFERERTDEFDGYVVDLPGLPTFRVRASVLAIPQGTMSLLVGLTASAPQVLDGIGRSVDGLLQALADLATGVGSLLSATLVGVPGALATGLLAVPRGLGNGLGSLSLGLSSLSTGASVRDWFDRGGDKPPDPRDGDERTGTASAEPDADPTPVSIDEAWETLVEHVSVRRAESRTPAEVARAAIDDGLPRSAVERLTAVFRDVRYGRYPRTDDRKRTAREALAEIRKRLEGDR